MKASLVLFLLICCCFLVAQQDRGQTQYPTEIYLGPTSSHARMTADDVIRLARAGVSDEVIIAQIQQKAQKFDLSANQILRLKDSGVSNRVIQAMVAPNSVNPSSPPAPTAQPNTTQFAPAVTPPSQASTTAAVTTPALPPTAAPPLAQTAVTPAATTSPMPLIAQSTPPTADAPAAAQNPQSSANPTSPPANDGKMRVYVTDRPITEVISMIQGGSYGSAHASGYASGGQASYSASGYQASHVGGITNDQRGGADPRTLEVSGDLAAECHISNLVITSNPAAADYILDFRRRGGARSTWFAFGGLTGLAMSATVKVDHAGLYKPNGDLVIAAKARTVGGAVNELCPHLTQQR